MQVRHHGEHELMMLLITLYMKIRHARKQSKINEQVNFILIIV